MCPLARPTAGLASRKGQRPFLCDAAAQFRFHESGVLAVAVVDGIRNNEEVATVASLCAQGSVRIGARKGAIPGVMTAAGFLEATSEEAPEPDAVMALAVCRPAQPTVIGYVGDVAAFSWNGTDLTQLTTRHTKGERLRAAGIDEDTAARRDNIVINSLARTTPTTIMLVETLAEVVLLLSDGVYNTVPANEITAALQKHLPDPHACATALIDAVPDGARDDATAAVIVHDGPIHRDGITQHGR